MEPIPLESRLLLLPTIGARIALSRKMGIVRFLNNRGQITVLGLGLILVVVLSIIDYVTPPEVSFLIFYLIPVLLVAWFAGWQLSIIVTFVSAVSWYVDDVIQHSGYSHPAIPYWNVVVKIGVFLVFTFLLVVLKEALQREKLAEQTRIQRELEIAREVQSRLFPQVLPALQTLEYTGFCAPAFTIGGDYYDFLQLSPQLLGIGLGDVAGKGISSALLMASLYAMVRSYGFQYRDSVALLMKDINRLMCVSTDQNRYATLFYGLYDDNNRQLTYVNAGHNPPIWLKSSDFEIDLLKTCGTPVGVIQEMQYKQFTIQMEMGDLLVLYTDGVTEAENSRGEEFGDQRLQSVIQRNNNLPAAVLRDEILRQVRDFASGEQPHDDLTLVVMKVL